MAEVSFPEILLTLEALGVMHGLNKTIFQCKLTPPLEVGQMRWLRLKVKPFRLCAPGDVQVETPEQSGLRIHRYRQLLDILGPDALLESLNDTLLNMAKGGPEIIARFPMLEDPDIRDGLTAFSVFALDMSFQKAGTYTRINDHRILLTNEESHIELIKDEGSVHLEAIAPLPKLRRLVYHWSGGLNFYWHQDPFEVASRIYDYVDKYASVRERAKSKSEITYAAEVDHILGCEIIDCFALSGDHARDGHHQYFLTDDAGESFYLNTSSRLPEDFKQRCPTYVQIAARAAKRIRPSKAHFRILFNISWQLATLQDTQRKIRDERDRVLLKRLAIWGFIIGVIALLVSLIK